MGPTLAFYKQFSTTPHCVLGRVEEPGAPPFLCCAGSLLSCDLSSGELQQSQHKRGHCVTGQECSGSTVRECHRAADTNGFVRLSEPCSRSRPWAKWPAWVFPVMETSFHTILLWLSNTRRTRLVWGKNIA